MAIKLDANQHAQFLAEYRSCPYTKVTFSPGDTVVFCRDCNSAHLQTSWRAFGQCGGCACSGLGPDILTSEEFANFVADDLPSSSRSNSDSPRRSNVGVYVALASVILLLLMFFSWGNSSNSNNKYSNNNSYNNNNNNNKYSSSNSNNNYNNRIIKFELNNNTDRILNYKLYDITNDLIWNEQRVSSNSYSIITISCSQGSRICYGAKVENGNTFWGLGIDYKYENIDDACFDCDYDKEIIKNLIISKKTDTKNKPSINENTYKAPANTYKAPANTYKAPANTYKAPVNTYKEPANNYKAPDKKTAIPYLIKLLDEENLGGMHTAKCPKCVWTLGYYDNMSGMKVTCDRCQQPRIIP